MDLTPHETELLAILRAPGPKPSDARVRALLGLDADSAVRLFHELRTKLGVSPAVSLRDAVRSMH